MFYSPNLFGSMRVYGQRKLLLESDVRAAIEKWLGTNQVERIALIVLLQINEFKK